MYNLSVNKLPESLTPVVGGDIIDYESPNLDYAYNSVFENGSDIHSYRIMPTQIKEAMVLWYDIARQGCTNENMAKNPVLRDLSGNRHNATCYNFGWSGMSGIGGYQYSFITADAFNGNVEYNTNKTTVVITNTGTDTFAFWSTPIPPQEISHSYKIRITGITGSGLSLSSNLDGMPFDQISKDGEYVIPEWFNSTEGVQYTGLRFTEDYNNQSCNITTELLPEYPYALVSDGVDDYCLVEELPLLNKEDGYTVIAKRKWLDEDNEGNSSLITKASSTSGADGAFMFECKHQNATQKITKNFGFALTLDNFYTDDITYQTSNSYNSTSIQPQSYIDTNKMAMFRFSTDVNEYYDKFALYSLLLFNRNLTPDEIEWVKRNLM